MDRRDVGSWLSGPGSTGGASLPDQAWQGELLGCPQDGPGSVAGIGRRVGALVLDWFGSILIVSLLSAGRYGFGAEPADAVMTQVLVLAVFAAEVALLTWLGGASAGQRVVGIGVRAIGRPRLRLPQAVLRTVLICLVIPPVVYDRDGRGLHDRAVGSIVVRTR
jgi:uncharacterized RDD family membrane protein YckC